MTVKKRNLPELASLLDERHYRDIEPANDTGLCPSTERIKALTLERIGRKEKPHMRKVRIALLAAVLAAVLGVTVAAMGGLDYFRSIFGDSVNQVADAVSMPGITATREDGYTIAAEAVLTDGYQTNIVFSTAYPKGKANHDDQLINRENEDGRGFSVTVDSEGMSSSIEELQAFSSGNRRYFNATLSTLQSSKGKTVTITRLDGGPELAIPLNGTTASKTLVLNQDMGGGRTIETMQLSPMGILLVSNEETARGGLPTVPITVIMKDGGREDATIEFDGSADGVAVRGGGSAVILGPGEKAPLVVMNHAERNPDGKMIAVATFSRLLDLSQVEGVQVEETVYPLAQ